MRRFAALALFVLHATAWADAPSQKPPPFRASLAFGAAARSSDQREPGSLALHFDGVAPPIVHFAGAFFFVDWLGIALDASYETFVVQGEDLTGQADAKARLHGFRLLGEVVGRWSPLSWVSVEAHLGYGGGTWPGLGLDGRAITQAAMGWHGPSVGFTLALEPEAPIGGQLFGRVSPALGGSREVKPFNVSGGLQLFFGNLAVGKLRGAVVLEGEVIGISGGDNSPGRENEFHQLQVRAGLGLRVREQPPAPGGLVPQGNAGSIRGRVLVAGIGLNGATVVAGALPPSRCGPDGDFLLEAVPPGRYVIKATADGYKPAEQSIEVTPGAEAVVTFGLSKPSGPGRIKGVVKGEKDAPVEGAEVALEGKPPVKTAADGTFMLEQAGPGPVRVTVKAKGYRDGDDAAQVPPEGVATLDFALLKAGERQPATIRGSVRAASGKVVKATVKVSDVNLTIPIKGDGRFVVQVPGGKYTLTIEAAGYVTQVKSVEVADGDQAIFHCDLQPAGR